MFQLLTWGKSMAPFRCPELVVLPPKQTKQLLLNKAGNIHFEDACGSAHQLDELNETEHFAFLEVIGVVPFGHGNIIGVVEARLLVASLRLAKLDKLLWSQAFVMVCQYLDNGLDRLLGTIIGFICFWVFVVGWPALYDLSRQFGL